MILLLEIEGNTNNDRRKYSFFQSYRIEGFPFKIEGKTYLLFPFYSIQNRQQIEEKTAHLLKGPLLDILQQLELTFRRQNKTRKLFYRDVFGLPVAMCFKNSFALFILSQFIFQRLNKLLASFYLKTSRSQNSKQFSHPFV